MNIGRMKTWANGSVTCLSFLLLIAGATAQQSIQTFEGCAWPISGQSVTIECSGTDNKDPHGASASSWSTVSKRFPSTLIIVLGNNAQAQWASVLDINATYSPLQQKWGYDLTIKNFNSTYDGIFKCELLGATARQMRVAAVDLNFADVEGDYEEKWNDDKLASRQLSLSGMAINSTADYIATYVAVTDSSGKKAFLHVSNAAVDLCGLNWDTYEVEVCFCGSVEANSYPAGCAVAPKASFKFSCSKAYDDYLNLLRDIGITFAVFCILLGIYLVVISVFWKQKTFCRSTDMLVVAFVVLAVVCIGFIIGTTFVTIKAAEDLYECDVCQVPDTTTTTTMTTVASTATAGVVTTIPTSPTTTALPVDPNAPGSYATDKGLTYFILVVAVILALGAVITLFRLKLLYGSIQVGNTRAL